MFEKRNRADALRLRLPRYWSDDEPCPICGSTQRYTHGDGCCGCAHQDVQRWSRGEPTLVLQVHPDDQGRLTDKGELLPPKPCSGGPHFEKLNASGKCTRCITWQASRQVELDQRCGRFEALEQGRPLYYAAAGCGQCGGHWFRARDTACRACGYTASWAEELEPLNYLQALIAEQSSFHDVQGCAGCGHHWFSTADKRCRACRRTIGALRPAEQKAQAFRCTQAEAKKRGLPLFTPEEPCQHCGEQWFKTGTRACTSCHRRIPLPPEPKASKSEVQRQLRKAEFVKRAGEQLTYAQAIERKAQVYWHEVACPHCGHHWRGVKQQRCSSCHSHLPRSAKTIVAHDYRAPLEIAQRDHQPIYWRAQKCAACGTHWFLTRNDTCAYGGHHG